jgi:hypothetical protein
MSSRFSTALATRLLRLPDVHGALLADFDHFPTLDLLHIRWHGHLTSDALVQGARAGLELFAGQPLPRRLLTNHSQVTGEWAEALPWLQYEWLPEVTERGVCVLAHVLAKSQSSHVVSYQGSQEFTNALQQAMRAASFRNLEPAWHWLTHR